MSMNRERSTRSALVGFLAGLMVGGLVLGVMVWREGRFGAGGLDTSRPTVVRQIQDLRRLETVMFGMDKIVSGGRESAYLPSFLSGDRLLLLVYGEVVAGVDLGKVASEQVTVGEGGIRVTMPEPELFVTRIDNDRTRVYSRETGLFSRVDPQLESEVRREAERQVRQAALDNGVLDAAAANARTTVTSFLRGLGFEHVDVR